jgi:hypothetical protein
MAESETKSEQTKRDAAIESKAKEHEKNLRADGHHPDDAPNDSLIQDTPDG